MAIPSADPLMTMILTTTFPTFTKIFIRSILMRYRTRDYFNAMRMLPPFGTISIVQVGQIYQSLPSLQGNNSHLVISLCKGLVKAKEEIEETPNLYFYPGGTPMYQSITVE